MLSRTKWITFAVLALSATVGILATLNVRHANERRRLYGLGGTFRCAIHLKQIGLALLLYTKSRDGHYPAQLENLVSAGSIDALQLTCPWTKDSPAATLPDLEKPGHNSFVFLAAGRVGGDVRDEDIVAHEPLSNHAGDGAMALFGDGHVDWLTPRGLKETLARAQPAPATTHAPQP
jgi:hypothetical protein